MGLIIIILIILLAIYLDGDESSITNQPNVTFGGHIDYPTDIKCECGCTDFSINNIDTSTWDMICPKCNNIAYKHPKREERQEQIKNMLDW